MNTVPEIPEDLQQDYALVCESLLVHDNSNDRRVLGQMKYYIERIATEHSAHVAAMAELNAQLESEQQAHNTIASILFAAGIETSDGTSVSAARNAAAELAIARAETEALRKENELSKRNAWFNDFRPIINAIGEISVQEAMDAIERDLR